MMEKMSVKARLKWHLDINEMMATGTTKVLGNKVSSAVLCALTLDEEPVFSVICANAWNFDSRGQTTTNKQQQKKLREAKVLNRKCSLALCVCVNLCVCIRTQWNVKNSLQSGTMCGWWSGPSDLAFEFIYHSIELQHYRMVFGLFAIAFFLPHSRSGWIHNEPRRAYAHT